MLLEAGLFIAKIPSREAHEDIFESGGVSAEFAEVKTLPFEAAKMSGNGGVEVGDGELMEAGVYAVRLDAGDGGEEGDVNGSMRSDAF